MAPLHLTNNSEENSSTDSSALVSEFSEDNSDKDILIQYDMKELKAGLRNRSSSSKNLEKDSPITGAKESHDKCEKLDEAKHAVCQNNGEKNNEEKKDSCVKCKENNDQKFDHLHVYHKKKSDSITKNSSIRQAMFEMSPQWLKSFLRDPEYVMNGGTKKHPEEIHHQADSLFSTSSGFNNYRGLLNLCIILLVLSNARLFLENIIKYGILIDPVQWVRLFLNQPYSMTNLGLIVGSNIFVLLFYFMEKLLLKNWLSETAATGVQAATLVIMLLIPAGVVTYFHPNPAISTVILGMYTVMFLKLISYASVNKWCRQAQSPKRLRIKRSKSMSMSEGNTALANGKEETMLINYPDNLTLENLLYFMLAPTLCYELNFPRSLRVRKRFLLKRIIEMLFLSQLIAGCIQQWMLTHMLPWAIIANQVQTVWTQIRRRVTRRLIRLFLSQLIAGCIQQWMLPLVHNSLKPLADMDVMRVMERLLKLAIPNHFIWLMFFYWFFHSTLNVLAELLKFGDREFYKDWWNSDTVNQFWTHWNVPVHRWASRHVYKPLVKRGCSKLNASVAVFFVSAFFHEYLLSVPLRMFRLWAFMGMLGQVPLAIVQTRYIHGKLGNMVVWLSLILGQPIAILAYFHDYYVTQVAEIIPANQTITT